MNRRRLLALGAATTFASPGILRAAVESAADLPRAYRAREVRVRGDYVPGSIHIETKRFLLYLMLGDGKAMRYGVAVGEEGRNLTGDAVVGRKVEWPSWTPTANMIRREPRVYGPLAGGMAGGPDNPLGARALYLYRRGQDTRYRIHGTPQPWTIGQSVSSGCIRLHNDHIIGLYERVPLGTQVTVYS